MPRGSYVYIVMDIDGGFVGFTVKHELVAWLKQAKKPIEFVIRVRDGGRGVEYYYELPELLND